MKGELEKRTGELKYLVKCNNPKFGELKGRCFFLSNASSTFTVNEVASKDVLEFMVRASASGKIFIALISGREVYPWFYDNFIKPIRDLSYSLGLTKQEKENVERGIILGAEMMAYRPRIFSDTVWCNIPDDHPALREDVRNIFKKLALDVDDLPRPNEKMNSLWERARDANGKEYWHAEDKEELRRYFASKNKEVPAITCAILKLPPITCGTFGKNKKFMINIEFHRKLGKDGKWKVRYSLNDPEILQAKEVITKTIIDNNLQDYLVCNFVATSANIEEIVNGKQLGKAWGAKNSFKEIMAITKMTAQELLSKTLTLAFCPTDIELTGVIEGFKAACCYCGDLNLNPLTSEQAESIIAQAKPESIGVDAALEALKVSSANMC